MAQRPRISQLKRTDVNYRTFKEQFEELESESKHMRAPVMTRGELPMTGNLNGSQCLVISEGVIYYWDESYQNWRSALGRIHELPKNSIRRYKKVFTAEEGQTIFQTDALFNVGYNEVDVYIQGILQDVNKDYYEVDERTIEFIFPLEAGMEVTIATPMIIHESLSMSAIQKRLEELEYNHYQIMMNQYYSGKPIDAKGMVYDGFLNTNYVDYMLTTTNVIYDNILKTIRLRDEVIRRIYEQFDNTTNIDPISTALIKKSEMTLPVNSNYTTAFIDDFSTKAFLDMQGTSAYHDIEKEWMTTVDTYAGGDHYYKGDFMETTGNADRVGSSQPVQIVNYYYYDPYNTYNRYYVYSNLNTYQSCYSVLPMGNWVVIVNDKAAIYKSTWPYTADGHIYRDGDSNNAFADGDYRQAYNQGYNQYKTQDTLFPDRNNYYRPYMTYIRSWNKIFALKQYYEPSNRFYQRLISAAGRTSSVSWVGYGRPTNLPNTLFGSETSNFSGSSEKIDQIGSTYNELLLRVGSRLYFLNSALNVIKVLDWTSATRKPSLYNVVSCQMTADKRYLYFPARLNRDGYWGYYLEVFDIEDGSFVNEILVSRDNSGNPGTTAMGFDHDYNRLVIGQKGGEWLSLFNKGTNSFYVNTSYAGFAAFEAPNLNEREVHSKPITMNLETFQYQLTVQQTLNSGTIDYYIRFNAEAWQKINPGSYYTWINPKGTKETNVQLRAVLRSSLNASTSPILTGWELKAKQYQTSGLLKTKTQLLDLDGVTGGKLLSNQSVPSETSLKWSIQFDTADPEYPVSEDGSFSTSDTLHEGYVSVYARAGTNNTLLSPVVQDMQVQFHQVSAGVMATQTFNQIDDINDAALWVTTGASHDYYRVFMSRNGGDTWVQATKDNSVKQTNGTVETLWKTVFDDETDTDRRNFKIKFEIDGVTEFHQYGAMLN